MANSLGSAQYSDFAAAQMLLGIAGTIASALVPLPLSHAVAGHPAGSDGRRDGLAFALLVSLLVGSVAALVTGTLTAAFAPASMALAVGVSALVLFLAAAPLGWLQGELRFKWYALASLGEITVRLGFTLLVVAFAWGATGGVLGFALGALALLAVPLSFYRDLRFHLPILRQRWRWAETGDIALVLCVVSVLVGLDVVVIAFLDDGSDAAAGFQALATIAKGPVYVAAGTALVAFPLLRSPHADADEIVTRALRSFNGLALPAAAVIATVPHQLISLVLPTRYHPSLDLLPWLAASGLGYATMSVLATILLALRRYRRCQVGLVTAGMLILAGLFIGWELDGVSGLAIGSTVGSLCAAAVLATIARSVLPPDMARMTVTAFTAAAMLGGLLSAAAVAPVLWILATAAAGVIVLFLQRREGGEVTRIAESVKTHWQARRSFPRLPSAISLAVFASITAAAFSVRAIGLSRSFELQGDELLYAELGRSVSFGQMPNLELQDLPDGPFFLHPPGFFLVEGLVIRALGLSGDSFELVYDLRWLNAIMGALSVGIGFFLVRKLTNVPVAWITAVVLAFEPFVLRNHSRVYLETLGTAAVMGGLLVIVSVMMRRPTRQTLMPLFLGGLLLGYGILTKDVFVLVSIAPVVLAVVWRRTLPLRQAAVVLLGSGIPYAAYLAVLDVQGMLPGWIWAKTYGARRMLGFEQETGFNAEGAPSLISRMIEQAGSFGTSYVLLGLGPLAAMYVCFSSRPERRLLGLSGLFMGLFGLYSAAFGTFEEQYGYPVMIAGILSIAVSSMEICERRPALLRPTVGAGVIFAMMVVALGLRAETTRDNGFAQFREWMAQHLPADSSVSVTNITGELAFAELSPVDDPRFGAWPSPELMEQNDVDYVLTQSTPTIQGYGYAPPETLEWLKEAGTEVVSFDGPTNGTTTLWHIDEDDVRNAAEAGIGPPTENYYAER
ncbi:glycosyltransferase family 39 protein [Kocuria rosea]|uniref:glycosyltransferase family 39 protein n=1 Tax=Kocuria rosea TaxID=1275 RepID=UPI0015E811A2|nr:glycosyltransferase family 39 protein [Kocuria rosea]